MVQLHCSIEDIHRAGAELVVIGNGTPSFIAGFRETTGFEGPLYTDPTLAAYQAAELERGMLRTFSPRGLGKAVSAFRRGARQGRTQGDAFQQGGVLVIAPGGKLRWRHASKFAGDNAPAERVVAALA
ncbi:MAG: peroxiredoxin-like family protein [Kofleriaceae bacterium]